MLFSSYLQVELTAEEEELLATATEEELIEAAGKCLPRVFVF